MDEDSLTLFEKNTVRKKFSLFVPGYDSLYLVKHFGIQYSVFDEFGRFIEILKGCIINDTVYGDISFILNVEDKVDSFPE